MSQLHVWRWSFLLLVGLPCFGQPVIKNAKVCLGEVCFRPALSLESDVIQSYGNGRVRGERAALVDERSRCYFDPQLKAYALFEFSHAHTQQMRVSHLFVSAETLCKGAPPPAKPLGALFLNAPIALGDSQTSVLKRLGPPQRKDDMAALEAKNPKLANEPGYGMRFGREKWVYFPEGEKDSLLGWSVHFEQGQVKSVAIWDSP